MQRIFALITLILWGFMHLAYAQVGMREGELNVLSFDLPPERYNETELWVNTADSLEDHPEFGKLPFNAQCNDCYEVLDKRTIDSRLFYKKGTNGQVLYKQQAYGALHYETKDGRWRTIDHQLKPVAGVPGKYEAPNQPIPVTVDLLQDYTTMKLRDGSTFRFNDRTVCMILDEQLQEVRNFGRSNNSVHTAGNDGTVMYNAWPGIDRQYFVNRAEVKTEYVLEHRLDLPASGWLVFEEQISFNQAAELSRKFGGIELSNGLWFGGYELRTNALHLAKIDAPKLYDSNPYREAEEGWPIAYRLLEAKDGSARLQLLVDLSWLQAPERVYPVVIDPFVYGSNTYTNGWMGFKFDPICFDSSDYCAYQMTVIVPGKSTITSAWFDARYNSKNSGCGIGTLCRKKDAAFSMEGPCGTSPRPNGFWTCDSSRIISTIPGLCYGDSIVAGFRHLVMCVPPSCPDHVMDFEMRTYHCSCILPGCDTACHIMRPATWSITVEARTLEGYVRENKLICPGDQVRLQAFGSYGVPPYNYSWSPGGQTAGFIDVSPVTNTTYYCTITDQCGVMVVDSAEITIRQSPTIVLSKTDALCSGGSDGSANAIGGGTQGPYGYEWSTTPVTTTAQADSLRPGWYTVTVTDDYGCTIVDSIEVGYQNLMEVSASVDDVSCNGFGDGAISLSVQGNAPYQYQWGTGDTSANISNLVPGTYRVTVTDVLGCFDTLSAVVTEPPAITVDAGLDQSIVKGQSVTLQGQVVPSGTYQYQWTPPSSLSVPSILTPSASPDSTTIYTLRVSISGNPDCWQEDSVTVFVLAKTELYVPTAFSPNGDGQNDVFEPKGDAVIRSIRIFNRWGTMVYEGVGNWDGTYRNQEQPMGVYIYVIEVEAPLSEEPTQLQGNVTLLR